MSIISRFAPSPTGRLHLGHAYSAMLAHDTARAGGGQFRLRIEDIDEGRCRAEFGDGIFEDLRWLGLQWDGEVLVQSTRGAAYAAALSQLDGQGLVYRCTCTRREIAESAGAPQGEGSPPYPGTCKGLGRTEGAWRLDMEGAVLISGRAPLPNFGDIVIARKDMETSYHLAVTVDDAAQGITHVIRGNDLAPAADIHRLLQTLLGLPTPVYQHHPLIADAQGEPLAKRKGSPSLASMRAAGVDPAMLIQEMRAGRFPVGFAISQD